MPPDNWSLEPHPDTAARDRAVATRSLKAGTRVLVAEPAALALLPALKGERCDWCVRVAENLRRCSRCAAYYYCDAECQSRHWTLGGHRRVCKVLPAFLASAPFQRLSQEQRTDALLLTHLLAAGRDLDAVLDLLPHPRPGATPPTPLSNDGTKKDALYARFENNNFVLHSHLTPLAAAVYPAASRALNHSCAPNAVPLFVFAPATPPRMEVVLVRDVAPGDEITIPYIDPALAPDTRHDRLRASYAFDCTCLRCTPTLTFAVEEEIPEAAARFSAAAHDGPFDAAVWDGDKLLSLYRVVYPPFYPLIGLHLAELAKTAWNAALRAGAEGERQWFGRAAEFVREAQDVLGVLGDEGDAPHPREELDALVALLAQEGVRV